MSDAKEKLSAMEHLAERLNAKDQEIEELRSKHNDLERRLERERPWTEHRAFTTDPSPGLPVPRLEIRWRTLDDGSSYRWLAEYSLVYQHMNDNIIFVQLSGTRVGTDDASMPFRQCGTPAMLELPFRDGAHINSDAQHLNLPAFVIYQDHVEALDICSTCRRFTRIHKNPEAVCTATPWPNKNIRVPT